MGPRLATTNDAGEPSMTLIRSAAVRQWSGEAWPDVALTLSTVRPSNASTAPTLTPVGLDLVDPNQPAPAPVAAARPRFDRFAREQSGAMEDAKGGRRLGTVAQARKVAPIQRAKVAVATSAFAATYTLASRVSVATGRRTKQVEISRETLKPEVVIRAAPRRTQQAFVTASFKAPASSPVLAGQIALFRDGAYVGRGRMPDLAPGKEHALGFGSDPNVKVTFATADEKRGQGGILVSTSSNRRDFTITLENRHDRPIRYHVRDRLPVSLNDDLKVTVTQSPEPAQKNVDDRRGIDAWEGELAAGKTLTIKTGIALSWSGEKVLSQRALP
ncbi:MAG: DUF4139 domain-containing protein [Pseudomonadota bacterium]